LYSRIRALWQSGIGGKLIIGCGSGCGGLVVLLLLCGIIGALVGPTPDTSPLAQATEAQAITQTTTPNPTSTPTPIPPTATLEPIATFTLEPTATAVPTEEPTIEPTRRPPARPAVRPTNIPEPTSTPEPTATSAFQSGGLGLTQTEWEAKYGEPIREGMPGVYIYEYEGDELYVDYYAPPGFFSDDIVQYIERNYDEGDTVPLDTARAEWTRFLPVDAQRIKTYEYQARHDERLVDLYISQSLASRFEPTRFQHDDPWLGGEPGNFIVVYPRTDDGRVDWWHIETGNSP
jgi:hypothetical protein